MRDDSLSRIERARVVDGMAVLILQRASCPRVDDAFESCAARCVTFFAHASPDTCPRKYCKEHHIATSSCPPTPPSPALPTCIGVPNVSEFVLSGPCFGCIGRFVAAPCLSLIACLFLLVCPCGCRWST